MRKNLSPKVWGRTGWNFLKHCAEACDEESFPRYLELLRLLPEVLPCEKCRRHAAEYLARNPPRRGEDLAKWIEDFEAAVRARKQEEREEDSAGPGFTRGYLLLGLLLIILVLALCCISVLVCIRRSR